MDAPLDLDQIPDRMSVDDLWTLLGSAEHECLEFKSSATNVEHAMVAMAMTVGGLIALGIDDDRVIVGCPMTQRVSDQVQNIAHQCGVPARLREISVGRSRLTLIAVPEVRERIVTTRDGRLLRRVGSTNQPQTGDAMARFVRQRGDRSSEEDALGTWRPEDFDLDLVNRALSAAGRPRAARSTLLRALVDLQVARLELGGPVLLLAAPLLFARDPTRYVPGARVQIVRRVGTGPGTGVTEERVEVSGPLPTILDRALTFIAKHTRRYEAVVGPRREELSEYPVVVLREAILNALAHRDYGYSGATVDITIWDDRIEVQSPGSLPLPITLENIRAEHYSRNRRVMHVLKLLRLVEEYGEGMDRMFREMEARLMDPPVIEPTSSSVTVTLRNRSLLSVDDQAWLSLLGHLDVSVAERRILALTRREGAVTRRSVRHNLGDVDAEAVLSGAVAKGLLVLTGRRGGARYVLSEEVIVRAGATGLEARSRQKQQLLDEMSRRGSLSTVEAMTVLDESNIALVRHLLNDLVRARRALARGQTRARRYYPAR